MTDRQEVAMNDRSVLERYLADKANREAVGDMVMTAGFVEAAYYGSEWADLAKYAHRLEDQLRSLRIRSGQRFIAATPEELD